MSGSYTPPRRSPTSPTIPTGPHSYESFSDLVSTTPPSARRGLFSSTSSSSPGGYNGYTRRWGSGSIGASGGGHATMNSEGGDTSFGWTPTRGRESRRRASEGSLLVQRVSPPRQPLSPSTEVEDPSEPEPEWELSTLGLICLTIGLAGAQLAWTVEMAFGTPYLLALGLSKESTSLVWLAGPLSGLLVQPTIGALSDRSTSPYRRRFYIVLSATTVILSTLAVAYAREIASLLGELSGLGDWDPEAAAKTKQRTIFLAVAGFYVLDFSLNGLQASLRALILDQSPRAQQVTANAWHGRMTHIANIFGYLAGYLDLGHWDAINWVGGGQFRKLAVLSCFVMAICVGITCWTQVEKVGRDEPSGPGGVLSVIKTVSKAVKNLPVPVRRVCYVQFFAWTAFFPFLFYSTTWVAEVFYNSLPPSSPPPSSDTATRAGSLALLIYAIVSLMSGSLLPFLSTILLRPAVARRISTRSRTGKITRKFLSKLSPRNLWTFGLVLWALAMFSTFWVSTVHQAMAVVGTLGITWAIACWVPFALVMEAIRDATNTAPLPPSPTPSTPSPPRTPSPSASSPLSKPNFSPQPFRAKLMNSRQPSLHRIIPPPLLPSSSEITVNEPLISSQQVSKLEQTEEGGTILGIHNLAIVAPQFFVAIVAALLFRILEAARAAKPHPGGAPPGDGGLKGSNDVVWVLRFGGLAAVGGAIMSRYVLKTRSEREYTRVAMKFKGEKSGLDDSIETPAGASENTPLLG
ncbi:MFS general substrate transporter [Meredithblackwellia eburnea MCA 4105]